jgi:hypothetical protein
MTVVLVALCMAAAGVLALGVAALVAVCRYTPAAPDWRGSRQPGAPARVAARHDHLEVDAYGRARIADRVEASYEGPDAVAWTAQLGGGLQLPQPPRS